MKIVFTVCSEALSIVERIAVMIMSENNWIVFEMWVVIHGYYCCYYHSSVATSIYKDEAKESYNKSQEYPSFWME